jgi:hypothetical protein
MPRRPLLAVLLAFVAMLAPFAVADAAPFTEGNIVLYRTGDDTVPGGDVNGAAIYLDEYTPAGVFVQSVAMPTTTSGSNRRLISPGGSLSNGKISRSVDGRYLMVSGFDRGLDEPGNPANFDSATVNRVIARVDSSGTINSTTALTDAFSTFEPSSVVSVDGAQVWIAGRSCCGNTTGGVRYATLGATTSTRITDVISIWQALIFDGRLYASGFNSGFDAVPVPSVGTVGSGLPTTSGQAVTNLPGLPENIQISGFFLADLDADAIGPDTLYTAGGTGNLLRKFNLVSGQWVDRGFITVDFVHNVIGQVSGNSVTLYMTDVQNLCCG